MIFPVHLWVRRQNDVHHQADGSFRGPGGIGSMLPVTGGWVPLPAGLWLGWKFLHGHHRFPEAVWSLDSEVVLLVSFPVCDVYFLSCLCQVYPPGGRSAALSPRSSASGRFTVRCGQTGAQLHHLRHHPRLQDGPDVHVRSLSGETDGFQKKHWLLLALKGESHFSILPLPLRLTPSPCPSKPSGKR